MQQSTFLSPTPIQSLKPIIAELISDVNGLLEQVSPGVDYRIDPETGAILGKRQKPSLSGEASYNHAPIGWVAVGGQGTQVAAEYFKSEAFSQHIYYTRTLLLSKRQERIDNLNNPDLPITMYDIITVACVSEEMFVEAIVAELEERGFVVETVSTTTSDWSMSRYRASQLPAVHCPVPNMTLLRTNRDKFVNRWSGLLRGSDYATTGWQHYQPGMYDQLNHPQGSDQQLADSANTQPE